MIANGRYTPGNGLANGSSRLPVGGEVTVAPRPALAVPSTRPTWGVGEERPNAMVEAAVRVLAREGWALRGWSCAPGDLACHWARAVAECLASGECKGGVLFCQDPGLAACVANKVPGLRAVGVTTVGQAARATLGLGANLLVVEMPGRTFFEIRQILRTLFTSSSVCPEGVACTLGELDGHAHR